VELGSRGVGRAALFLPSGYPGAILILIVARAVSIPKKTGGQRILGAPTVADRVAQMVVKQLIEPDLEPIFWRIPMAIGRENRPAPGRWLSMANSKGCGGCLVPKDNIA
jgi:hypothetical protein